jgi:hypothetical protein
MYTSKSIPDIGIFNRMETKRQKTDKTRHKESELTKLLNKSTMNIIGEATNERMEEYSQHNYN